MDKKNTATGATIVNRSDRRKAHKPVKAETPIGVPSVGSAPVMVESVETETIKATEPEGEAVKIEPTEPTIEPEPVKPEPTIADLQATIRALTAERNTLQADIEDRKAGYVALTAERDTLRARVVELRMTPPVNDGEVSAIERNILRRLFTGDKGARSIMLDVVTDLCNTPDKDGNTFDVNRDTVGARIPKGLLTGVLRIAKGQYDNTHPAYALGKSIGGKAAVKAGGKDDLKAITDATAFLDIGNSLPNLVAGIQRMTRTVHQTADVMRENDVDKVPAFKATASERLAVVEKAQNGDDKAIADFINKRDQAKEKAKKSA
jgi:hypothetical protein